jgi:hypothetical protein
MSQIDKSSFEKVKLSDIPRELQPLGGKLRNWRKGSTGEFLSRIWCFYGEPDEITYEGFEYTFRDVESDVYFRVYCGPSGPAYGSSHQHPASSYHKIADAFDSLLEMAKLVDCAVEFETDFGLYRCGVQNGIPFEEERDKPET